MRCSSTNEYVGRKLKGQTEGADIGLRISNILFLSFYVHVVFSNELKGQIKENYLHDSQFWHPLSRRRRNLKEY